MFKQLSLPSKINSNPALPAAFIPFFRRIFFMAYAMKIHLKMNAAANGLELKERLQGLTATDVTHGYIQDIFKEPCFMPLKVSCFPDTIPIPPEAFREK